MGYYLLWSNKGHNSNDAHNWQASA